MMLPVAIIAGLAVTLGAVMPQIGAAAVGTVLLILIAVPVWATRRRNRKAVAKGRPVSHEIKGSAHGLATVGTAVRALAARKIVTIPVVLIIGAFGLMTALNVESGFELKDFLASDTDVVQSLELYEEHFPSSGEGDSIVYVEGDLTNPATLEAIDAAVAQIDASDADFGRYPTGELILSPTATDIVRTTMDSPVATAAIASRRDRAHRCRRERAAGHIGPGFGGL